MSDPVHLRCAVLALLAGPALAQTTWYVDAAAAGPGTGTALDPFPSIQVAIDQPATADGDVVLVLPGTYHELVDLRDKELVLRSSGGPGVTTIDGTGLFSMEQSVVKIRGGQGPSTRLEGFTLAGGEGTLTADPAQGWELFVGGGLLVIGSSPTIAGCVLRDNEAECGGGAYVLGGEPVLTSCAFLDNVTNYFGSGTGGALLATFSKVTLSDVTVAGNLGGMSSGVDLLGGSLSIQGGSFTASLGGGPHLRLRGGVTAEIAGTSFSHGHCIDSDGGAVWITGGDARFEGCSFEHNSAGDSYSNHAGGAIYAQDATVVLRECTATGNTSAFGGAVYLEGCTATIEDSLFADNGVRCGLTWYWARGGAVGAARTSLTVARTRFERNSAVCPSPSVDDTIAKGGALWCDTPQVVVDLCEFVDNEAYWDALGPLPWSPKLEPGAQGGALFGPALVKESVFSGNRAHSRPTTPGVWVEGGAAWGARLLDCSFTGNAVVGTGPEPDTGPAAEASLVLCFEATDNLPADLEPFGPLCDVPQCLKLRSSGYAKHP